MPKVPKEEAERNKKILAEMLKQTHNKECADCTAKGPTWSPWNWGVFVCIKCAGIHRKMGTHISKVKSCTLDQWFDKEVVMMRSVGNKIGEQLYAAKLTRPKPDEYDDNVREEFIRSKYEKKLWMRRGAEEGALAVVKGTISLDGLDVADSPITPENPKEEEKEVLKEKPRSTRSTPATPVSNPTTPTTKSLPITPTSAVSPLDILTFEESTGTTTPSTQTPTQYTPTQTTPIQQTPPQAKPQQDSKTSILSLFDAPQQIQPTHSVHQAKPSGYPGVARGIPMQPSRPAYPQPQPGYPVQQGYPVQPGYPGYPPVQNTYPPGYPQAPVMLGRGAPVQGYPPAMMYRPPAAGGMPPQQMMYRPPQAYPQQPANPQ